ncbi:mechanosensitive ion channel family protein [Maricaulis maris]|uniref:Small-conductance mechanosensitive channel n=1 Tax=Maricaulis maris TaxID=74318 RepID=A0A495DMV9_9PROT|nr:mechanosensitive ion channel family protein [Maricaulis maris]RKR03066.1 small-conductance mechanosensitive channel [Maricaulis maris]
MFRLALLAFMTLLAWVVHAWVGSNLLFADTELPGLIKLTAGALTALLVTFILVGIILEIGLRQSLRIEPVGAQRVVIFIIVTFAISAIALKLMGFDITTILTTSALLTAIIGFALQPTLGGLFSGIALQLDSHLKPGDGIRYKGENVKIESMNWRSVVGRKRDETLIIIPNSSLAGEPVEIYPNDRPVWSICRFSAPMNWPPQFISDLVRRAVADLDYVDAAAPVMVLPESENAEDGQIGYRVRYKVAYYFETPELDCEVLRRLWYCFQREGIPLTASRLLPASLRERRSDMQVWPGGATPETLLCALAANAGHSLTEAEHDQLAHALSNHARILLFGPNERIALPAGLAPGPLLLVAGSVHGQERGFSERRMVGDLPPQGSARHYYQRLSPNAVMHQMAVLLADQIGPYAERVVSQAAIKAPCLPSAAIQCAAHIDDAQDRAAFLAVANALIQTSDIDKIVFTTAPGVAGTTVAMPACRAVDEAVFLALDPAAVCAFDAISPRLLTPRS